MARRLSIRRQRVGGGFVYEQHGAPVSREAVRRIERLAIPPAWEHVEIAASRSSKVLARGIDAAGRTQAIYNPQYRRERDEEKFRRVLDFAQHLPELREHIRRDLRRHGLTEARVLACVLTLVDQELFRVGSPQYAHEHGSFGVTTLTKAHTTLTQSTLLLHFAGKSGQEVSRKIRDARVIRVVRQLLTLPGELLFQYEHADGALHSVTAEQVNSHLHTLIGNVFTVKDFRTWGGNAAVVEYLATAPVKTLNLTKSILTKAVKHAASELGNTPAVARSSYIDPRLMLELEQLPDLRVLREQFERLSPTPGLRPAEQLTLKLLNSPPVS